MKQHQGYLFKIFPSKEDLNVAAAEFILEAANKAVSENGKFIIALSGGKTPQDVYAILSRPPFRDQIPWNDTFIFWGDERCVPLDDEKNNAFQAKRILLEKVDVPLSQIFQIPVNELPATAAEDYEKKISLFFNGGPAEFDLVLLGLGENGHTASLFPNTNVVNAIEAGVKAVYSEEEGMFRITMTAPMINQARQILFLVTGENKSEILKKMLNDPFMPEKIPALLIRPIKGELHLFADQSAASGIQ